MKFGRFFQLDLRHYVLLGNRIREKLLEAHRLFHAIQRRTQLELSLMLLADLLVEVRDVIVWCMKKGAVTTSLHNLRQAQEIVHKMFVFQLYPELAEKERITPGEVRKRMGTKDFHDWKEFYDQLSDVVHNNRTFMQNRFPLLSERCRPNTETRVFIEYYFASLNMLSLKALAVLHKVLTPHLGNDVKLLQTAFAALETPVHHDWDYIHKKQRRLLRVLKEVEA